MLYFIYGQDSYRSRKKIEEIVGEYKRIHMSGLNFMFVDAKEREFEDFLNSFKISPMFAEKKLVILKNVFSNKNFQEKFLENFKKIKDIKDIIIIFEEEKADERTKLFKTLKKEAKCQEFSFLSEANLKKWIENEFKRRGAKIDFQAENFLLNIVGNNLWQMENEIKKLVCFKKGQIIKKEDIDLHIKPKIENDIFKTIEALAAKNKKQALFYIHNHIESGDNEIYILSMIAYQFRNLLIVKELIDKGTPHYAIAQKSGLNPFVVKKTFYLCNKFSLEQLKKIYKKIFQTDLDIKSGKIHSELALDMFIAEI
jgi:DNA polymerase-3 subunit delta